MPFILTICCYVLRFGNTKEYPLHTEWNKEGIQVGTAIRLFVKHEISPSFPNPFSHSGEKESKTQKENKTVKDSKTVKEGGNWERWEVPRDLEVKMIEIARQFRKEPTPSEAILWKALRKQQIDGRKFRRQQPIGRFVVDFFCAAERLIVEIDGGIHESQKNLDCQRQQLLETLGLRFVRVSSEQVETNLAGVWALIRAVWNHPHPLTPSPIKGEGEPDRSFITSPTKGKGEPESASLPPSPLVGEGAGG